MTNNEFMDVQSRCDVARARYTRHNKPSVLVDAMILYELLETYDRVRSVVAGKARTMNAQRLDEIISAAGFTPECYQHEGEAVISVTMDRGTTATPLTDMLGKCDSPAEGLELVRGVSMRQTPTELILFWPDARWII